MCMLAMFACKRSQIISVLGYNLLAGSSILALQQMFAKLHLCIFTIRSACGHLMTGEAVVPLLGAPLRAKTYCFPSAHTIAWDGKARHCWLPVAIFPLTYIPAKSFPPWLLSEEECR